MFKLNIAIPTSNKVETLKSVELSEAQLQVLHLLRKEPQKVANIQIEQIESAKRNAERMADILEQNWPKIEAICFNNDLSTYRIEMGDFSTFGIELLPLEKFEFLLFSETDKYKRSTNHAACYAKVKSLREPINEILNPLGLNFEISGTEFELKPSQVEKYNQTVEQIEKLKTTKEPNLKEIARLESTLVFTLIAKITPKG